MPMRNVSAYVLHRKVYGEGGFWVNLLTCELGRVSAIYRPSRRAIQTAMSPFQPLVIELTGQSELLTLVRAEEPVGAFRFEGPSRYAALYVNELMYRLLPLGGAVPGVFAAYGETLRALALRGNDIEPPLRSFELLLLQELGAGLQGLPETDGFDIDPFDRNVIEAENDAAVLGLNLDDAALYYLDLADGEWRLVDAVRSQGLPGPGPFPGARIRAFLERAWDQEGVLALARRVNRCRIDRLLNGRALQSRELMRHYLEMVNGNKSTAGR